MTFHVGQKVVCVDASGAADGFIVKGAIYTVRWLGERPRDFGPGVMLDEASGGFHEEAGVEYCFCITRFRPIVERKTDISIFTAMLNPSKQGVDA